MGALVQLILAAILLASAQARPKFKWLNIDQSGQSPAPVSSDLERESSTHQQQRPLLQSPAQIGQQLSQAARFLSRNNGRLDMILPGRPDAGQLTAFQCVPPASSVFKLFSSQYNRTFQDPADQLERQALFATTLRRAIVLNRVIQDEVLNTTNKAIRNYHFIEPKSGENFALWYADITDCELALLKNVLLDVFDLIDQNKYHVALSIVQSQGKSDLPSVLDAEEGFEQLANILLVRLFDRFKGDSKMNQLFEWPMYFKRLASYAYSQQEAQRPDFKAKIALVSYAYPAYFKDLKYNHPATNRTHDNLRANEQHLRFYQTFPTRRLPTNLKVLNKRLSVFRQRWSLINALNNEGTDAGAANQSSHHLLPDWLRVQYQEQDRDQDEAQPPMRHNNSESARLIEDQLEQQEYDAAASKKAYQLTQFSDLTDVEFQAYLSNDFSLLGGNKESIEYLEQNFHPQALTSRFRWEIAHELETRRGVFMDVDSLDLLQRSGQLFGQQRGGQLAGEQSSGSARRRPSLRLAKQVVDELISDVGLPIGPAAVEDIKEDEHVHVFQTVARFFKKPYMLDSANPNSDLPFQTYLTNADLLEERVRRYERFTENHGRFKAWFVKEDWQRISEAQRVAMLRLADMSWLEIKLSMFKLCCLTGENIISLSSFNATIQYLGSNYDLLCSGDPSSSPSYETVGGFGEPLSQEQRQQQSAGHPRPQPSQQQEAQSELSALELYYYYSVHFNKHHLNRVQFERSFATFRRNIEAIRYHSCRRSLTLYESLKNKRADLLSTIDVLDPRRSHTDDLNLDRFHYFKLPASSSPQERQRGTTDLVQLARQTQAASRALDPSRSGVSYRRDFFGPLFEKMSLQSGEHAGSYAGHRAAPYATLLDGQRVYSYRLHESYDNSDDSAQRYRRNNVANIYQLVMARYKKCKKDYEGQDLGWSELKQQCQANGRLGDHAVNLGSGFGPVWDEPKQTELEPAGGAILSRLQNAEKCAFYRQGLDAWPVGLIQQEPLSAQLIRQARC